MARIRTVKPEFFHSRKLSKCSPHARLLAIALLQMADCEGRIRYIPMQIHSHAFPWESNVNTPSLLGELADADFVIHYEFDGDEYLYIPNFLKHQRLQGKEAQMASKLPPYNPESRINKGGNTPSIPSELTIYSQGMTGTGEQGNRGKGTGEEEKEQEQGKRNRENLVTLKRDDAKDVFEYWRSVMNHPRAAFDEKRQALIRKQLKHYNKSDLLKAIHGCSVTPHNMGDNDRGEVYDSIELIFRDSAHIDRFMKNSDNPPSGKVVTIQQTQSAALAQATRVGKQLFGEDYEA